MPTNGSIFVNAEGQVAGRMASRVTKLLLNGEHVTVINAEKAVISGKRASILREYSEFLNVKSRVQPKYTPRHARTPENFIKAVVRGMLPRRKTKGVVAFRRLRVYAGDPESHSVEAIRFEDADVSRVKGRYITVGELLSQFSGGRGSKTARGDF